MVHQRVVIAQVEDGDGRVLAHCIMTDAEALYQMVDIRHASVSIRNHLVFVYVSTCQSTRHHLIVGAVWDIVLVPISPTRSEWCLCPS